MRFGLCFLFIQLLVSLTSKGQQAYVVSLECNDCNKDAFVFKSGVEYDSIEILLKLNNAISNLRTENYLLANLDSVKFIDRECFAYIFQGDKYSVEKINYNEDDALIVNALGINRINFSDRAIDATLFNKTLLQLIEYLNSNGYPFATVEFDKPRIKDNKLTANLKIRKNQFITFDTLDLVDEVPTTQNFLSQYLNIIRGASYDHQKILDIERKINDVGFLKLTKSPWVSFINEKAIVRIPLKAKPSNSFDFLIGVLPSTENGIRKINVNGQLFLDLLNRFGRGERVTIDLQRLSEQDQFLSISANYPYLFKLPIGLDGSFNLRRNRDISIDLNTTFGGQYILNGQDNIKGFAIYKSSSIINIDTSKLFISRRLPDNLDYKFRGGGIALNMQNIDYRFSPTKGWEFYIDFNLGLRSIIINQGLRSIANQEVDFNNAYDTLTLNTFQNNINLKANRYIPVSKIGTIKLGLNSGWRYNNGRILENELYRIGGQRLLRGFDEQTIFTDLYAVFTSEFRLLLDQNSYLSFPFIDVSRYRTYQDNQPLWDTAIGMGLGLNFATKAGIFNVSFAAGSRLNNPIDFNNTKVHFGFVSLF